MSTSPSTFWTLLFLFSHLPKISQAAALRVAASLPSVHGLFRRDQTSQTILSTWQNPSDTLSILLIIGSDVIHQALAQLSGHSFVPVAFSFGWVAYSFNTLRAVVGDGRLMPPSDHHARVINAENGYCRDNKSWVLGRLLRDFEYPLPNDVGLSITVFEAGGQDGGLQPGVPTVDWYWISGVIIIVIQLGIAAIPCGVYQDWGILLVTAAGTVLALATGALPQWHFEKWACRQGTKKVVSILGGNGARHVMVIIGKGKGLDLEDLANAESPRLRRREESGGRNAGWHRTIVEGGGKAGDETIMLKALPAAFWITQIACLALALLWIALLITVTSLKENAWYLLAIGGIGMIQNVVVAGARREGGTTGIHLETIETFRQQKAMDALMDLETAYPKVGKSLVEEFFPGIMRPDETEWWAGERGAYDNAREKKRPQSVVRREISEKASRARKEYPGVCND